MSRVQETSGRRKEFESKGQREGAVAGTLGGPELLDG